MLTATVVARARLNVTLQYIACLLTKISQYYYIPSFIMNSFRRMLETEIAQSINDDDTARTMGDCGPITDRARHFSLPNVATGHGFHPASKFSDNRMDKAAGVGS